MHSHSQLELALALALALANSIQFHSTPLQLKLTKIRLTRKYGPRGSASMRRSMPLSLPVPLLPLAPPAFAAPDEDDLALLDADLAEAEAEAEAELAAAAADRRGRWAADGMTYLLI